LFLFENAVNKVGPRIILENMRLNFRLAAEEVLYVSGQAGGSGIGMTLNRR
jgi:hypothetical protein